MKIVKDTYKAIIDSSPLWIIGGVLIGWGIHANGWIRMGIGILFIYWGIITAIKDYKLDRQIEKWINDNEGKFIFFYATKKKIQEKIKSEILPMFEANVLQAYYDGPKIVGDFEKINFLIRRIMNFNPKIKPHNPSIIKVENGEFVVKDELKLLMNIETEKEINKQELKIRIKKACA